jgi:ADYC domain-containing protein/pentapeptide repeat protein
MRIPALLSLLGACAAVPGDDPSNIVEQEVDSNNGTSLNGTSLNGTSLNGTSLNGTSLNGTSVTGTNVNGSTVTAVSSTAPPVTGSSVVGSTWNGTASNGTTVKLRIDSAQQLTAPNAELWAYGISYQTSSTWTPLCGLDGTGAPIKAIPVAGYWSNDAAKYYTSSTTFTWGCRGKTVAKCVELGYKTYKGWTSQYQSCVRLLRADYCGTGISYTVDGTLLNLYDNKGIQLDTEAWKPEAEWDANHAICINSSNAARYENTAALDTRCVLKVSTSSTCATSFKPTTLLIDELP